MYTSIELKCTQVTLIHKGGRKMCPQTIVLCQCCHPWTRHL